MENVNFNFSLTGIAILLVMFWGDPDLVDVLIALIQRQ